MAKDIRFFEVMSRTKIRNLIKQGAIEIDGEKIIDPNTILEVSSIVRIGKKTIKKVVFFRKDIVSFVEEVIKEV